MDKAIKITWILVALAAVLIVLTGQMNEVAAVVLALVTIALLGRSSDTKQSGRQAGSPVVAWDRREGLCWQ